jgi:hypothetical protein
VRRGVEWQSQTSEAARRISSREPALLLYCNSCRQSAVSNQPEFNQRALKTSDGRLRFNTFDFPFTAQAVWLKAER